MPESAACRVCGGEVVAFMDFGEQPISDCFLPPESTNPEHFYRLVVGACESCTMVQLLHEVPRERMFHDHYPYHSSGSARMREHFRGVAERFVGTELTGDDAFIVELGCNDGVMLASRQFNGDTQHNMIVLSDGADTASRATLAQASGAAESAGASGDANVVIDPGDDADRPVIETVTPLEPRRARPVRPRARPRPDLNPPKETPCPLASQSTASDRVVWEEAKFSESGEYGGWTADGELLLQDRLVGQADVDGRGRGIGPRDEVLDHGVAVDDPSSPVTRRTANVTVAPGDLLSSSAKN